MAEKLFLIDGTAIIYRAFFAFIRNPLINSKGQNTGAIYGTVNSFLRMIDRYDVKNLVISFDRREKTFRHELDETYKANRPSAPEELHEQVEPIKQFFKLIEVPEISVAGYEADDVLATIAEKFKTEYEIIIVTGDKDFSQLVDDRVMLYDPYKEETVTPADVEKKYGLKPEQFIDYLALCGDSADNIPGVPGIGPKNAATLLNEYNSLDEIYQHLDVIAAKGIREKLASGRESAFLSRKLAAIVRDVPLPEFDPREIKFDPSRLNRALPLLRELELKSLIRRLEPQPQPELFSTDGIQPEKQAGLPFRAVLINKADTWNQLKSELAEAEIVALDTETTDTDPLRAEIAGVSICFNKDTAYYISLGHVMDENLSADSVIPELKSSLRDKLIIGHNVKYDYLILSRLGWKMENPLFDTMIADYLLHPTDRHSLSACARRELEYEMIPIKDLIGSGKKQTTFDLVAAGRAADYSAEDAWVTFRLHDIFRQKLKEQQLTELFDRIEMPLVRVLAAMEQNGVFVDTAILADLSRKNQKKIAELTTMIYEIAGYQFNLNSTQQLGKLLFEELGIPALKQTKTGYSTDVTVLEELAGKYEIARLLMSYRILTKLESTYITALPRLINPATGRIHSSFNQTVASTGRLSSSNPNLQNIPVRSDQGKEIRTAFIPQAKDFLLLSADYSQIELRILAILSRDPSLIQAFQKGWDIHSQTASLIYNKPREEVTADERRYAKIINFGLLYGMGSFRISNELNISREEAQEFIDNYFNKFPTVRKYIDDCLIQAKNNGYVATIFGRRLYLPGLLSTNRNQVREAERIAINMPIQGSAADLIKIAMINIHKLIGDDPDIRMMIQVHDELVFEIKETHLKEAGELIVREMKKALPAEYAGLVELEVEVGTGKDWYSAH